MSSSVAPLQKGKCVSAYNMSSSADVSPSITPCGTPLSGTHAPRYGTVIPGRIFVGGIAANMTEAELKQFFTAYGAVKDSKIITDRAGVSKGYGFVTFENQEDAERIIKKESDNLIFRDRKLNIGQAVRKQQVLPRTFDTSIPTGTVMFSNGVPYTYQNGMAIFHAPEGGYPIHQTQVNPQQPAYSTMMVPQTPTMYVAPPYSTYQPTTPQWANTAAQWRWTPQSPSQALSGSPGYIYAAMHASPELMYAQPPPHAYQPDLTDAAMLEGAPVEGNAVQLCQEQTLVSHAYVTDASLNTADQQQALTSPYPTAMTMPVQQASSTPAVAPPMLKSSASVAPYPKKTITTIPRRTYSSPTYLVKHGNKVQRVMTLSKAPPSHVPVALIRSPDSGSGDATEGVGLRHSILTPPPEK